MYRPYTSFYQIYFTFFMLLLTLFLKNLVSDCSLLAYRHTTDLCVLIFYSVTLLKSLISSSSFLIYSLRFSTWVIISSANKDIVLLLMFQFVCLLFLFLALLHQINCSSCFGLHDSERKLYYPKKKPLLHSRFLCTR